jgi:hypothetical protein
MALRHIWLYIIKSIEELYKDLMPGMSNEFSLPY